MHVLIKLELSLINTPKIIFLIMENKRHIFAWILFNTFFFFFLNSYSII